MKIRSLPNKNQKGAAVVELAILLPLLLVMVFGLIEFGFLWLQNHYIANSAREGARVAAQNFESAPDREAAVNNAVIGYLKSLYPDSLFEDGSSFVTIAIDSATIALPDSDENLAANRVSVTVETQEFRLPTLFTELSRLAFPEESPVPTQLTETAIYPLNTQP